MAGSIWAVAEISGGTLARVSGEIATIARDLAAAAGTEAVGVVVAAQPDVPAQALAAFVPRVLAIPAPELSDHLAGPAIAARLAALAAEEEPSCIVFAAGPDGRDAAGTLAALLGWGVLVNAVGVEWQDDGPRVTTSIFGGKLVTESAFAGDRGILTVRANAVPARPLDAPGEVEVRQTEPRPMPLAEVVERVEEPGAAVSLEDARVIVSGGRGVGGPEGFRMVEELAAALGGAVGATRAAVDAGWIPYSYQIGQTGRIVKPSLYVALGISGAIQHKVGMQTAETIVAVNRDPEAPIAEFADMLVVGDVFQVVPEILQALRSRTG